MSTGVIIALIVAAAAVVAVAAILAVRARGSHGGRGLKQRFGPEYDRAVARHDGDVEAAERELGALVERHGGLRERPLEPAERERFEARWTAAQEHFVDSPSEAVVEADHLLAEVAGARGFPDGAQYDEQLAALSVHHADHVHGYRRVHRVARVRSGDGDLFRKAGASGGEAGLRDGGEAGAYGGGGPGAFGGGEAGAYGGGEAGAFGGGGPGAFGGGEAGAFGGGEAGAFGGGEAGAFGGGGPGAFGGGGPGAFGGGASRSYGGGEAGMRDGGETGTRDARAPGTEDMRAAMVEARALFDDLLGPPHRDTGRHRAQHRRTPQADRSHHLPWGFHRHQTKEG